MHILTHFSSFSALEWSIQRLNNVLFMSLCYVSNGNRIDRLSHFRTLFWNYLYFSLTFSEVYPSFDTFYSSATLSVPQLIAAWKRKSSSRYLMQMTILWIHITCYLNFNVVFVFISIEIPCNVLHKMFFVPLTLNISLFSWSFILKHINISFAWRNRPTIWEFWEM